MMVPPVQRTPWPQAQPGRHILLTTDAPWAYPAPSLSGFSLIELLIAISIVGILAGIAWPSYNDHVRRSRLPEATTGLATKQAAMEQWFLDNRSYYATGTTACFVGASDSTTSRFFTFTCSAPSTTTYTITATGSGSMAGFVYTIDQVGNRATTGLPAGWTSASNCWVVSKSGTC